MSDERQPAHDASDTDGRSRKTRQALLGALVDLVHDRRYDEIRASDIAEDAGVGRSTFYEHYSSKDDMIVETMSDMLDVLAAAASEDEDVQRLEMVLRHFWENRAFARHMLSSAASQQLTARLSRELARRIESHLNSRQKKLGRAPVLPFDLIASQAAEAEFALIRAWLSSSTPCSPAELAIGLRCSTMGAISALLRNDGRAPI